MALLLAATAWPAPVDPAPPSVGDPVTATDDGDTSIRKTGSEIVRSLDLGSLEEQAIPLKLVEIARAVRDQPLGQRMKAVSDPLLGRPYRVDAAGEGRPPDADPPARYDEFDCLTFVEEVLALALTGDPSSAPMVRQGLRYDHGLVSYSHRNHFMLEEWIPRNIAAGWVEDITASLGETHLITKQVTLATWRGWRHRRLYALSDEEFPVGRYALPVLSLDAAAQAVDRIPPGAIILTVRVPRRGVPIVVTHVGFTIPTPADGIPRMRHATRMGDQRVRDERLPWYIEHLRWYDHWPVEGITVLMPREMGPRLSRLWPETVSKAGASAKEQ